MKRNSKLSGAAIVGCISCSLALTVAIFFMLPWLSVPLVAGLTIISIGMGLYDWALTAAFFLAMWAALSGTTIARMKFGRRKKLCDAN